MSTPTVDRSREFNATDYAILEFEALRWGKPGRKVNEILDRFAMTEARYAQVLVWVIRQPEAEAYNPTLVRRLRDLEDKRRAVRTRGTVAAGVETRPDVRGIRPALLGGVVA